LPGRQARDTIHRVFQIRSWTTRRCSEGLSFLGSAARCILTSHLLVSMTVSCEKSRAKCFSFFSLSVPALLPHALPLRISVPFRVDVLFQINCR